jgi:hypothetical protein
MAYVSRYAQPSPVRSPDVASSPSTPSRPPHPSRAGGADSERKVPQVLRLVAKPHAKVVPGRVASKDVLACAAANASPTTVRSEAPAPSSLPRLGSRPTSARNDTSTGAQTVPGLQEFSRQRDEASSRFGSGFGQSNLPTSDETDSLWELVWQPIESLPALCAPQPGDVPSAADGRKRARSKPTRSQRTAAAPTAAPEERLSRDVSMNPSSSALEMWPTSSRARPASASGSPAPIKRRLRGKQPHPDLVDRASRSPSPVGSRSALPRAPSNAPSADSSKKPPCRPRPRGHYDVLGLPKAAAGSEIRAAYRRMALATHPDKGGDPDDFRRVVVAFEELGDESRRAAYDRNLELFGSRDGSGSLDPTEVVGMPVDPQPATPSPAPSQDSGGWAPSSWPEDVARWWYGAARVALMKLLDLSSSAWARQIASMQEAELQALLDLLRGTKILVPAQPGGPQGGANRRRRASTEGHGAQDDWGYQGIQRSGSGYKVVMSWANLSISSVYTDSLAQAIDWQIAFAWLRSTAQARLEECLGQAADPLIVEELMEVLAAEPAIDFTFTIMVTTKQGKKVQTPPVSDLSKALVFQERLRASAARSAKALEAKLEAEASECMKRNSEKKKMILSVALKELQNRVGDHIPKRQRGRPSMKRPASADPVSVIVVSDVTFKPTRRIRCKSSPALLAIVQGSNNAPAKSRYEIVSRAHAWQGIPQPGTPSRQPGTPARQPGTPAPMVLKNEPMPGTPKSPLRGSQSRSPSRCSHLSSSPPPSFRLSNLCSSPPPRNAPRSPLRSPMPSSLMGNNAAGSGSPLRSRSPLRSPPCSPLRRQPRSPLRSPMRSPVANSPGGWLLLSPPNKPLDISA